MIGREQVARQLKEAGYKFTGPRRLVIDVFFRHPEGGLAAKDVLAEVQRECSHVSPDTVYRTIALLEQLGVVEPLDFSDEARKYRLACGMEHHHHLVCLRCGAVMPLPYCPLAEVERGVQDFSIVDHRFELYGYCKACQQAR
ncbi:Fur family transcriptional regulator [Alicyclobacillus shizuokensis]|uniref:Fur family transcriptional regulator n=1 Tax=Alicyclobacillus shizuokensis TaxID=392014 RepID=UPI000833BFC9|nr:Fur family transcriptional regulator [Alicyclobacillus shizuokensis]MCL6626545.1 transcriptional repressor [Alicyclobacillus shizuokensis]